MQIKQERTKAGRTSVRVSIRNRLEMELEDGVCEPLASYIVLEQAQAAVDMLDHRLIHVKKIKPEMRRQRWSVPRGSA